MALFSASVPQLRRLVGGTLVLTAALLSQAQPILAQQALRVGVTDAPPANGNPFAMMDPATRSGIGAGAEIIQAVAEDLGLTIEWVPINPGGSNPVAAAFADNQIDVNVYPFQMTDSRKAQFDFTDPIYSYGEVLAIRRDDQRDYRSATDLAGRSVAVVSGSAFVDIATRAGANVVQVATLNDAYSELIAQRVDAVMGTAPTLAYVIETQATYPDLAIAPTYRSDSALPAGFGVRKENPDLLASLNASLAKLRQAGIILEISDRWGVSGLVAASP
jgi:polar amino acid transport system substrate-binding protein